MCRSKLFLSWISLISFVFFTDFAVTLPTFVEDEYKPQQVHLSYTGNVESMFVTWTTLSDGGDGNVVFYEAEVGMRKDGDGAKSPTRSVDAVKTPIVHQSVAKNRTNYVYRATMTPLTPSTTYYYYVQSGNRTSSSFEFTTFPDPSEDFRPVITIYGDMGVKNHVSLPKLIQDAKDKIYDIVLHIGDFGYNMNEELGRNGDEFMKLIEPIAASIPYNVAVGNHEYFYNFTEYTGRFTAPDPSIFYYSIDVGPIHFILFSSEFYFYGTIEQMQAQYDWLIKDLERANRPEARNKQPWIVALAHRPMYCSTHDHDDCSKRDSIMRLGYNHQNFSLESLFYQNGVDLQVYAHEHNWERTYPIYNYLMEDVSDIHNIQDPVFPVHMTTGSAGCREYHDPFTRPQPAWSIFRSNNYGFTLLSVEDRLKLKIQQYSINRDKVIDQFVLQKSQDYPNFKGF